MKKFVKWAVILFTIICCMAPVSFYFAKNNAKNLVEYKTNLSPLKGTLVLFINGKFRPCWLFKAEHNSLLTGGTFDIYVSLIGEIIKKPSIKDLRSD